MAIENETVAQGVKTPNRPARAEPRRKARRVEDELGDERLLTADELAVRLRMTREGVFAYVAQSKIPCVRLSKRIVRFHWPTVLKKLNC